MTPLPIDPVLPQITSALQIPRAAVVVAAPGAGKTTRIPPAILAAKLVGKEHPQIVMLQPRRVAARAAASRIAEENGWTLGREVGYQVRFERVMERDTPLRVVTEGILTRQLLDDPFLEKIGAVILDEFHERSIHSDLSLALLREIRQSVRPDLIVLVMSATLHAEPVSEFLGGCPIIRCPGKMFPVEIAYRAPSGARLGDFVAAELRNVLARSKDETGDVLVFLPGAGEIRQVQESVHSPSDLILPLYGNLPFEEQVRALRPADRRKIILATNIAETSLTIPGVRTVIDSGWAREAAFDSRRGLDQLQLTRISKASAEQRCGRAGRTASGQCIRLWTAKEQAELPDFDLPEIQRVDLASTVLALHGWGIDSVREFGWYQPPSENALAAAEKLLWMLGALGDKTGGKITPLGRRMLSLPVHPRLARLLIAAADMGLAKEGAALSAILSERDIPQDHARDLSGVSDLLVLLGRPNSRLQADLLRLVRPTATPRHRADETDLLKLALLAYPDRVCRRRGSDPAAAVMVGGGGVRVARESVVRTAEFFIAVDVRHDDRAARGEALVRIASAIEPDWLVELFPAAVMREDSVHYDTTRQTVVGMTQSRYLDLVIREQSDVAVNEDSAAKALAAALRPRAAEIFAGDESAAELLARLAFVREHAPEHGWPQFEFEEILTEACAGRRSLESVQRAPLADLLRRHLVYPLDRLIEELAPRSITLPRGKQIRFQYDGGKPPILSAKLQDLLGLRQTPRLAGGRIAARMEILGPNYRPVQVTDDLASFWATTYFQVKKDLKRRYPKHAWPDDPLKHET